MLVPATKTQTTIVHTVSDGHAGTEFIDGVTLGRAQHGRDNRSLSTRKRRDFAAIVAILSAPHEPGTYTVVMDGIVGEPFVDDDTLFTSITIEAHKP